MPLPLKAVAHVALRYRAVAVLFNISPMMQVPMLFSLSLPKWFHCAFLCVSVRLTCTCVCVRVGPQVVAEQLQLEKEREAQLDTMYQ